VPRRKKLRWNRPLPRPKLLPPRLLLTPLLLPKLLLPKVPRPKLLPMPPPRLLAKRLRLRLSNRAWRAMTDVKSVIAVSLHRAGSPPGVV